MRAGLSWHAPLCRAAMLPCCRAAVLCRAVPCCAVLVTSLPEPHCAPFLHPAATLTCLMLSP